MMLLAIPDMSPGECAPPSHMHLSAERAGPQARYAYTHTRTLKHHWIQALNVLKTTWGERII